METKNCIEPTNEQFQQLMALDYKGPVWLVNLLKFKKDGGRESYLEYGEGMQGAFESVSGQVVLLGAGLVTIVGAKEWNEILMFEFPSIAAHLEMLRDEEFQAAVHHRAEALEDSRFFAFKAGTMPKKGSVQNFKSFLRNKGTRMILSSYFKSNGVQHREDK